MGILKKRPQNFVTLPATVNGLPGFVMQDDAGVHAALGFGVSDGRISTLYMIRNPDKLARIELP
jgi:RNA polymerase sigma-70 factor (ECF subfamily)